MVGSAFFISVTDPIANMCKKRIMGSYLEKFAKSLFYDLNKFVLNFMLYRQSKKGDDHIENS